MLKICSIKHIRQQDVFRLMRFQKDDMTPESSVAASLLAVTHLTQLVNSRVPEVAIYLRTYLLAFFRHRLITVCVLNPCFRQ